MQDGHSSSARINNTPNTATQISSTKNSGSSNDPTNSRMMRNTADPMSRAPDTSVPIRTYSPGLLHGAQDEKRPPPSIASTVDGTSTTCNSNQCSRWPVARVQGGKRWKKVGGSRLGGPKGKTGPNSRSHVLRRLHTAPPGRGREEAEAEEDPQRRPR